MCAGLARRFGLNATGLRWAVALVALFFTGIPVLVRALKARPAADGGAIDV